MLKDIKFTTVSLEVEKIVEYKTHIKEQNM